MAVPGKPRVTVFGTQGWPHNPATTARLMRVSCCVVRVFWSALARTIACRAPPRVVNALL